MGNLNFYRNDLADVYSVTKDRIVQYLNSHNFDDGVLVLGRYVEDGVVKSLIGVSHKPDGGAESGMTIFEPTTEPEPIKEVEISGSASISVTKADDVFTIGANVSEEEGNRLAVRDGGLFVSGYVGEGAIDVNLDTITFTLDPNSEVNDFLYVGENGLGGKIDLTYDVATQRLFVVGYKEGEMLPMGDGVDMANFLKDTFLESVEMVVVDDEHPIVVDGKRLANGTYLKFVWNTTQGVTSPTYVNVTEMIKPIVIDGYVGVNGISVSNKEISINLADDQETREYLLLKGNTAEAQDDVRLWFNSEKIKAIIDDYDKYAQGVFVNVSGDTMHGHLVFNQNEEGTVPSDARIVFGGTHNTDNGYSIGYDKTNDKINIYKITNGSHELLTPLIDSEGSLYESWVREKNQYDVVVKKDEPTALKDKYVQIVDLEERLKEIETEGEKTAEFTLDDPSQNVFYMAISGDACVFVTVDYDGDEEKGIDGGSRSDIIVVTCHDSVYEAYCTKNANTHVYLIKLDETLNRVMRLGVNIELKPKRVSYKVLSGIDNAVPYSIPSQDGGGAPIPPICEGGVKSITSSDESVTIKAEDEVYDLKVTHPKQGGYETGYLDTFHWGREGRSNMNDGWYTPLIKLKSDNVNKNDISFEIIAREQNTNNNFYGRYMFTSRSNKNNLYCLEGFDGDKFKCINDVVYTYTDSEFIIYKRNRGSNSTDYWQVNIISRNTESYSTISYYSQYEAPEMPRKDVIYNTVSQSSIGDTVYQTQDKRCSGGKESSGVPIGTVVAFADDYANIPSDYALCDGRTMTKDGEVVRLWGRVGNIEHYYPNEDICKDDDDYDRQIIEKKTNGEWIEIVDLRQRFIIAADDNEVTKTQAPTKYPFRLTGGKFDYGTADVPPHYHTLNDIYLYESSKAINFSDPDVWNAHNNYPWWMNTFSDVYPKSGFNYNVHDYVRSSGTDYQNQRGYIQATTFPKQSSGEQPLTHGAGSQGDVDADNNTLLTRFNTTHYNGVESKFDGESLKELKKVVNNFESKDSTVTIIPKFYSLYYIMKYR